jgi:hypothetical protein
MCKTFSGFVTRQCELLTHPATNSHNDLADIFSLRDNGHNAVPVEFYPDDVKDYDKPEVYKLHLDAERPSWWDDELAERITSEFRSRVERMIIRDKRPIIADGCWILVDGAEVGRMIGGRIAIMHGGTLKVMSGGTLNEMSGGTLNEMSGGTLNEMYGGTLNKMYGGTLNKMYGGTLNEMRGGTLVNDRRPKP